MLNLKHVMTLTAAEQKLELDTQFVVTVSGKNTPMVSTCS